MKPDQNMTLKATVERPIEPPGAGQGNDQAQASLADRFSWPGRIALLLVILLSPWAFASVEHWAQRWITIGLMVGLAFWWFETALNNRNTQVFPFISILVLIGILIGLLQTLSFPDWAAQLALGRQPEIYTNFTGEQDPSVSISLDRDGTWHQIRLLVIALSGLLLGCRYFRTRRDIILLMSVITINGSLIAFFGIVHKLTDNGKMFWFHEVLLGGSPFGPFVNRNNGSGYLLMCLACAIGLFPILMAARTNGAPRNIVSREIPIWRQMYFYLLEFISQLTAVKVALLMATVLIASAIPSTLSRGGVVALLVASIGTVLVYGMARKPKNSALIFFPLVGFVLVFSGWIGFGDELMKRFDHIDMANVSDANGRIKNWKDTWPAVGEMGWFGSGLGSYKGVHRLYRTDQEHALFVYAENQYFQAVVEAGWPGLITFLLAWLLAFRYATLTLFEGSSPTSIGVGTMGVFLIFSQGTACLFDFGFYIPANMLLFAVLIGFLAYHAQALKIRRKKSKSWLAIKTPNYLIQILLLVLFAGATMVALDLHRRAALDTLMRPRAIHFDRDNMNMETTDLRIAGLSSRIQRTPTVEALNYVGELWMHRSRLALYDEMVNEPDVQTLLSMMGPEKNKKQLDKFWSVTDVLRVQENAFYLRRERSKYDAARFLNGSPIKDNLPSALVYFKYSRNASPLQPVVHLRIAEIQGVIGDLRSGDADMERALQLAPSNPSFRNVAGIYYLQSGNAKASVPHFKRYLELLPTHFRRLMNLITGKTTRHMERLDDETISRIIPANGQMLYEYVVDYMDKDSPLKGVFLDRAAAAVADEQHKRRETDILLGDIRFEQGDIKGAIDNYGLALRSLPNDRITRYKRARLLVQEGDLDEALKDAKKLKSHSPSNPTYNKFLDQIESAIKIRDKKPGLN